MSNAAKRPYLPELDLVRAFGIMAVIMIHATSSIVSSYDRQSIVYPLYVTLSVFSKFAVPIFIFLSGFVLFYNYFDKPFTARSIIEFYKKRFTKIVIPFLFFSLLYWGFTRLMNYGFTDWQTFIGYFTNRAYLERLLIGKSYIHLYFVVIIIQFYLLSPLMLYAVKRFQGLGKHLGWIGLLLQWVFIFKLIDMLELTNRGSYAFAYMFFFMAGASIGIYYMKLVDWIKVTRQNASRGKILVWSILWTSFLLSFGTQVYVYYIHYVDNYFIINPKWLELINELHCFTASIIILQLSYWIYATWNRVVVRALMHIGATSFGIYLLHPLILYAYREIDPSGQSIIFHLWAAGGFLVSLLLTWLIVAQSARFKWHWILFGPLPAKKKKVAHDGESSVHAN